MRSSAGAGGNASILGGLFGGPSRGETCQLAVMEIDKQSQVGPVFILGMPFLRYYYTVFDKATMKIHVAAATSSCQVGGSAGAFGFSNLTNLTGANATHFADASRTSSRAFAAEDYTPTS